MSHKVTQNCFKYFKIYLLYLFEFDIWTSVLLLFLPSACGHTVISFFLLLSMRSSRVAVTTNSEVFNISHLIEAVTKIAVALKFIHLENLKQEGLFSKKLRIYVFMIARLPFQIFQASVFRHRTFIVKLILWSTLKSKYWQHFSYFISEDFEDCTIQITKSQSCNVLTHYFQLLFCTWSLQNLQALCLLFWKCIGSHPFPGEKLQGNFADADDKLWEDKGSVDPIHYSTWVWNFEKKCYLYVILWWFIMAIIWNVCFVFPQKRLVV